MQFIRSQVPRESGPVPQARSCLGLAVCRCWTGWQLNLFQFCSWLSTVLTTRRCGFDSREKPWRCLHRHLMGRKPPPRHTGAMAQGPKALRRATQCQAQAACAPRACQGTACSHRRQGKWGRCDATTGGTYRTARPLHARPWQPQCPPPALSRAWI